MSLNPAIVLLWAYGFGAVFGFFFMLALLRTDWYRHTWGRNVMALDVALTAIETIVVTSHFFGPWPGEIWTVVILSVLIAAMQGWRWIIQLRGNRRQREARRALADARGRQLGG